MVAKSGKYKVGRLYPEPEVVGHVTGRSVRGDTSSERAVRFPVEPVPEPRVVEKRVEVERPWKSRDEAPNELKDFWDATPMGRDEVRSVFLEGMNLWVAVSNDGGTGSGFLWQEMHPKLRDVG
jgi:hypothetical protein